MISGEDESSSVLNGRLRPRKSTANIPNPPNKSTYKLENQVAQDKPKRNSIPSKASPNKQDDLTTKADTVHLTQLLCPYCDRKFTSKLSASKHARRIHLSSSKQDHFINCLFCNYSEAMASNVIRHMVDNHPNQYFACLDCNTRFLSTSELAEHKLNVCEKQKQAYRSKLRQKGCSVSKQDLKKLNTDDNNQYSGENKELNLEPEFNGVVISCELKPSHSSDAVDFEDNITTNLILPSNIGNTVLEKNAVIILDDLQWKRRIPPNFSFRNADADQILSRLGVVHRSPRVGESTRREWLKMIDVTNQKFEKCFDTNFYSRVASNVQQNLARFLDGSFNFSPDPDKIIKTRKTKSSTVINTAEGFPILLPLEQYSRNRFDGYMPRAIAPKHKWKWDSTENEKHIIINASVMKRDSHVDNCIITLVSSLDMWTQLRMRRKFEGIFCRAAIEKSEKQNTIGRELKEILESREIPSTSSQVGTSSTVVATTTATAPASAPATAPATPSATASASGAATKDESDFPSFLGLSARSSRGQETVQPAVLSGEWVRPRCYVCCACGDQTRDARALTAHMAAHHPNAQVQHYEIVGESLLNADILKHLYVPPTQMPSRTRPLRGFRDCTKCKKSITMEELHQHMLDCAGDTPTVRRKCRSRPFGVRRRRPRLPDNTIRKNMRKDIRARHNQKALLRARPRIRTEVGDAETIRKMIADLPAKRHRQAADNLNSQQVLRPRRKLDQPRNKFKIKRLTSKNSKARKVQTKKDVIDLAIIDEDDQPLRPKPKIELEKEAPAKKRVSSRVAASKNKKRSSADKEDQTTEDQPDPPFDDVISSRSKQMSNENFTQKKTDTVAKGNRDKGDEESRKETDKRSDEKLDKDNQKCVTPDATLLKHSINNITASDKASQLQPQYRLPQQTSESTLRDTQNILSDSGAGSSLPDKPPLQSNQKRSSQKKRESLLNCIEKIKSQQKGETMMYSQKYDADIMKLKERHAEYAQLPLMDPHPAVISRTHDESGAATNAVPGRIAGLQDVASASYQADRDVTSRWGFQGEAHAQFTPNDALKVIPRAEQFYVYKNSELSSKAKVPSTGKTRRSSSMRAPMVHNEDINPLARVYYPLPWHFGHNAHPMAHLQQQLEQFPTVSNAAFMLQYRSELLKNSFPTHYNNHSYLVPGQYNTSDLHYDVMRNHTTLCNETASAVIGTNLQSPNMLSLSPQSWISDQSVPFNHTNSNTPSKMLTMPVFERSNRRKSRKKYYEPYPGHHRFIEDSNMLNHTKMGSMPPGTDKTYASMKIQTIGESSHYDNDVLRSKNQKNNNLVKSDVHTTFIQDRYASEIYRDNDNRSSPSDKESIEYAEHGRTTKSQSSNSNIENRSNPSDKESVENASEHHRMTESQNKAANNQQYMSQSVIEEHPFMPEFGKNSGDSDIVINKTTETFYTTDPVNIIPDHFISDHPFITRSSYKQTDERTSLSNESITQQSIDTCDQIDDLLLSADSAIYGPNNVSYSEDHQESSKKHADSGSTEEPLDLSVKYVPHICNENDISSACIEKDQIQTNTNNETLDLSSTREESKGVHSNLEVEVDSTENNASSSLSNSSVLNDEQVPCVIEQNSANENLKQSCSQNSTDAHHKQIKEVKTTTRPSNSNDCDIDSTKRNEIDQYKSDSQVPEESISISSNHYLKDSVNLLNQLDKANEVGNEITETEDVNTMQSNDISNRVYKTENLENSNHDAPTKQGPITTEEKRILHKRLLLYLQNQATDVNTCSDETNDDDHSGPLMDKIDHLRLIWRILVEQTNYLKEFSASNTQLIHAINKINEPTIHIETIIELLKIIIKIISSDQTHEMNIIPADKELAINTAVLPSNSTLPKKRHSPSSRLNSQKILENINLALLFAELTPLQQSTSANSIVNDRNVDFSSGDKKEITEINECEYNMRISKVIDLTDDIMDHAEMKSNTPNSNAMLSQEIIDKLQTTSKQSNEKTASLRAVRIKTPLSRKSISDDKQIINKDVYNHQSLCIDSQQRDLTFSQVSNSEYSYGELTIDSASPQIPRCHTNPIIKQPETSTVENQLSRESSKFTSRVDYDHKQLLKVTASDCDEKDNNLRVNTVMQQILCDNDVEQKKLTFPFHKDTGIGVNAGPKQTQKNIELNKCLALNKTCTSIDKSDPSMTSCVTVQDNHITLATSNSICLEQQNSKNMSLLKVSDTTKIRECIESSDIISLKPNLFENMTPKTDNFKDANSADEVSSPNKVNKKDRGKKSYLKNETKNASLMNKKSVSKPVKSYSEANKNNQALKPILSTPGSTVTSIPNNTDSEEESMIAEKEMNEAGVSEENYKINNYNKKIEMETLNNFSKHAPLSKAADGENVNDDINSYETRVKCNEIKTDSCQATSSVQYFNANKELGTLIHENTTEISITPSVCRPHFNDTDGISAVKHDPMKDDFAQTDQSKCLVDSVMSTNLEETSEYALRRNRCGKSTYLDTEDAEARNIMNPVVINEAISTKLPVTKKQLIFSKLILDENLHNQIDDDVQTDVSIETQKSVKRKKSLRKNKKRKLCTIKNDDLCTGKLNFTSDNNDVNASDKEASYLDTSEEKNSLNFETMGHINLIEFNEDATEGILGEDGSLAKRSKVCNVKEKNWKQQDDIMANDLINKSDSAIKSSGRNRKVYESSSEKPDEMTADNQVAGTSGYNGFQKQPEKNSSCVETKTACYNRPIFSKQLMTSTTVAVKNPENYDPYDIDFDIDMAETTEPISKRKTNKLVTGSFKSLKKCLNNVNTNEKNLHNMEIEKPANVVSDIRPPHVSDSDSSISDEPLQKYVEEKEKLKNKGCKPLNLSEPNSSLVVKNGDMQSLTSSKNERDTSNTTCIIPDAKYYTGIIAEIDQGVKQIENTIELSKIKSKNTKKNNSESKTSNKSPDVSSETSQQLTPDKYMENFGFYSVRQPRKSNLLAAKKISETFHSMIESDDAYFRSKERQKKSSHNENRKTSDGNYASKVTQDTTNVNPERKSSITLTSSTLQEAGTSGTSRKSPIATAKSTQEVVGTTRKGSTVSTQPIARREAVNTNIADEQSDDGEVDLITAQRILNSEEIRKLERDLYSGFKEAAEANAGRTSGFNQLRVEDTGPRGNTSKDVFTSLNETNDLGTNKQPDKSEDTKMTDIPEELEDKPLMYPENKVNMFENKYDIIKRRRDAREREKQAELAKKAELTETPSVSKKKPDRKCNRKNTKKPSYQGSQVPTKGALKGFDGIKISIPTQDLNLPPNVSPPHYRQSQGKSKKVKETKTRTESSSSYKSDSDADSKKITGTPDIYEFQDEERPVAKGYRLSRENDRHRSSSSGNEDRTLTTNRADTKKKRKHNDDECVSDQQNDIFEMKKWKGKGKGKHGAKEKNKATDKTTEETNMDQNEKQKDDTEFCENSVGSKMNQRLDYLTRFNENVDEDNDRLSNDNTMRSPLSIVEPFNDSDTEDQTVLPSTSGFVPDRNDESSYESDSSSSSSVMKETYVCNCLKEIEHDENITRKGCSRSSCRYNNLNAAKNAVMGKIFKNNALRYDKSDDVPRCGFGGLKPKEDMDKLFDSLLVDTDMDKSSTSSNNILSIPGPSSATYINSVNAISTERDASNVDDGFSSPNHRNSEKASKIVTESVSPTSPNIENPRTGERMQPIVLDISDESMEEEALVKSKKYKASKNNTSEVKESSDSRHRKKKRDGQNKRKARSDLDTSAYEDEMSVAKLRKMKRKANKKHKSHHKRDKGSEDVKSGKQKKDVASSKRKCNEEKKKGRKTKRRSDKKLSPSRQSDEGISTSHDISADAINNAPTEQIGVAVQRARRKCTVGKQNVLAEHWSSSESETEARGKRPSAKGGGRAGNKGRRSHDSDSDDDDDVSAPRAPPPQVRARAAPAIARDSGTGAARDDGPSTSRDNDSNGDGCCGCNAERDDGPTDINSQERHGWVVGRSCKKLVEMLVAKKKAAKNKRKTEDENQDDNEDEVESEAGNETNNEAGNEAGNEARNEAGNEAGNEVGNEAENDNEDNEREVEEDEREEEAAGEEEDEEEHQNENELVAGEDSSQGVTVERT